MPEIKPRPTQTKIKHNILKDYVQKWGQIINSGLRQLYVKASNTDSNFRSRFVYVDGFSFRGRYPSETNPGEFEFGSPIIGIEALLEIKRNAQNATGFAPETVAILIEHKKTNYDELLETLESKGYSPRIVHTKDFSSLKDGDIAVIHGDFLDYVEKLLDFTGTKYTWSFYLLDPYGPSGIPMSAVAPIISQEYNDVMINFIYQDLHRKAGSAAKDYEVPEAHLEHYDAMYDSAEWRDISKKYFGDNATEDNTIKIEGELIDLYHRILQEQDEELAIKTIRLKFPAIDRTMLYLFVTTHDPTGALALNDILDKAELREYELREEQRNTKGIIIQHTMFDTVDDPQRPIPNDVDTKDVAEQIYELCSGEIIAFREVLRRMADTPYYFGKIKTSMAHLRKEGKVKYKPPLQNKSQVHFI
jgi:three-Cys-motif partner protein